MKVIDRFNEATGKTLSWLTLFMVIVSFVVVCLRYLLSVGWVWMQELVIYAHAFLFMGAAAYVLKNDQHVRVDIFYANASKKKKSVINIFGSIFLTLPLCIVIFIQSLPYVVSSWSVLEGSQDGGGLEAVFILKSLLLVFPVLIGSQAIAEIIKNVRDYRGG